MATIQNDRDVLLQAAAVRVVPVTIAISDVVGLPEAIAKAEKSLEITASAPYFSVSAGGFTTPSTITLTAVRKNWLSGTVTWNVESGSATLTPSGGLNNTCSISGPTVSGTSVIIRASVTDSGRTYTSRTIVGKYGALSTQNEVDLASQITGQLANGNVSGLGALALLGNVNLATTQVVGDLAASRIGVGTLAAGVIYAGTVNVENLVGTTISGKTLSGTTAVYVQGTNGSAPVAMYVSGGTGVLSLNGLLSVNNSSGVSTFNVTNAGNISGGSISGGTATDFRGAFTVRSTTASYANIESTSTYLRFRSDEYNFITAAGGGIMSMSPSRVTIQTPFLNLASITSDPGGSIQGDMTLFNNEVVIRIAGAWYKLTKTPL